jgi:hypothetical protein
MSRSVGGRAIPTAVVAVALVATGLLALAGAQPARALVLTPNCPWQTKLDPNTTNVAFPDQYANYFTMIKPFVDGGGMITSLTIRGRFPHTRYMSFTSYTGQTQAVDNIHDTDVQPDPGMADNPFLPGSLRATPDDARDYTVTVINGQRPASGPVPANTIYTTDADGSHSNRTSFIVIYRTYRPDVGLDNGGGEPLPSVFVNHASGPPQQLDESGCTSQNDPDLGVNDLLTNGVVPVVPVGAAGCYPGLNPPAWHKYTNVATAELQGTDNTCLMDNNPQDSITEVTDTTIPRGGFLENPDNKYVAAILNVDAFGAVLVVRSRIPTTPDTYQETGTDHGVTFMPGGKQLRYWSMCSNEGVTTRFFACVMDDNAVRLDADGDYCLALSRTSDRPRNADAAHHVNWLPYGTIPALHDNVLIMRNMLPDAGFPNSIQAATEGDEQAGLGAYFPAAEYMSVADFEAGGCPTFTDTTALGTQPGDPSPAGLPNSAAPAPSGAAAGLLGGAAMLLLLLVARCWGWKRGHG